MTSIKKPNCPICGCTTSWIDLTISSKSSEPSSLFGGEVTIKQYQCDAYFDCCSAAIYIYNNFVYDNQKHERVTHWSLNWRDGIKRYNHFIDFVTDNNLKLKLMALADEDLEIKNLPENL